MLFGIIVDTFSREYFILVTLCNEIDFLKVDKPSFRKNPEMAMAPHSSTLAWKMPWMEEPGGPQSMGLLGVGHD